VIGLRRMFVTAAVVVPSVLSAQNPPPTPPPTTVQAPVVIVPTKPTAAQDAAAAIGRPVSNERIADALKQSGMSEAQVRARLRAGGYDPGLADPFFSQAKPGAPITAGASPATSDFAKALANLGVLAAEGEGNSEENGRRVLDRAIARGGGVFGKDIFNRATTAFDPVTAGPVDAAYRIGVGDALQLIVTGQVELAYQMDVRRDGTVVIPQVGQVSVAGLTLDAARTLLKSRMITSYSGLSSGEARLDLSIARLRSNAVFVIGEVENPGAIQVNALSTVFHAIARAGGPTDRGSFRNIEVRRGNRVIQRLDLYDYLLRGDASGDIRLEQGDVIFVPLNERVVAITGAVRRPRIFELRPNEGFTNLLTFAGGLLAVAAVDRVQIDRVVSADKRSAGFERAKVDIDIRGNLDSLARVTLQDADVINVFSIGELRRNVVTLSGQVFEPGDYELKPRMTLTQLIANGQGLTPWALADRIKIVRNVPATGQNELWSIDATSAEGRKFELEEFDQVEVLDGRRAFPGGIVSIEGAVNGTVGAIDSRSGTTSEVSATVVRPFIERESLKDAIERAGGLREYAQSVDVFRRKTGQSYSDTTSERFSFVAVPNNASNRQLAEFLLKRDDRIVVRSAPGFRPQQFVTVEGQFQHIGSYAIAENQDRVRDVVTRAGGLLPGAYPGSFRLVRDGKRVSVDLEKATRGDVNNNLPLLGGDRLEIDRDQKTVYVDGAVTKPSLIRYRPGLTLSEYIELAGGPTEKGVPGKATIEYPSGFSARVKKVAYFFHSSPDVTSGSVITVPEKPVDDNRSSELWSRTLATATALGSLIVAIVAVKKL
jgi:polysaccharide export outer membrane protein